MNSADIKIEMNRLKAIRIAKKHTQEDVANIIGCSVITIYNYETGRSKNPSEHLRNAVLAYIQDNKLPLKQKEETAKELLEEDITIIIDNKFYEGTLVTINGIKYAVLED